MGLVKRLLVGDLLLLLMIRFDDQINDYFIIILLLNSILKE